jgi:hypothetical protein
MASERFAAEFQARMAERRAKWPDYVKHTIRDEILEGIDRWVLTGTDVGGFLSAVLRNDLLEAMERADENNSAHLREIVTYIYNECPIHCWDGRDKGRAEKWMERGGLMRYDPMTGEERKEAPCASQP